jgi:hypothetical protein|nr:MAG TPA: hypothetical protein [Caudoviricetes sp.]
MMILAQFSKFQIIHNLAFPSLELGIGNAGMKSGKYLLYFFSIFHNHNKATYIRSPFLL